MKMSGLCWTAVMLMLLLSAENRVAALNKHQLANIVHFIMERYNIRSQVSVAVNIPLNVEINLDEIFKDATREAVYDKFNQGLVYTDTKVVIAKPKFNYLYTDHAEALVLDNIGRLAQESAGNFLVFFSYYSPCWDKCTKEEHEYNILKKINEEIPKWDNHFFAFYEMFDTKKKTTESLEKLGKSKIGQDNIFACYAPRNKFFQCFNCFSDGKVAKQCVDNKA